MRNNIYEIDREWRRDMGIAAPIEFPKYEMDIRRYA